jgi:putative effector of murein hydrolase LrgA (UPF0299 family)
MLFIVYVLYSFKLIKNNWFYQEISSCYTRYTILFFLTALKIVNSFSLLRKKIFYFLFSASIDYKVKF